jgi:hypothetical protein
MSLRPRYSA